MNNSKEHSIEQDLNRNYYIIMDAIISNLKHGYCYDTILGEPDPQEWRSSHCKLSFYDFHVLISQYNSIHDDRQLYLADYIKFL